MTGTILTMPITTLVFDCDGVMVEPGRFARFLSDHYPAAAARTGEFFTGPFFDCLLGRSDIEETIEPYVRRWRLPFNVRELLEKWFEIENAAIPEMMEHVSRLRVLGFRCYLATNQERLRARYIANAMHFADLFDGLFFSCDLGSVKPDPAFFQAISKGIDADPSQILFWDDSASNVESARLCGWYAELFTSVELFAERLSRHPGIDLHNDCRAAPE